MRHVASWLLGAFVLAGCPKQGPPPEDVAATAEAYYIKGVSEGQQGHYEASLQAFQEVENRRPKDPRLPAARGEVYLAQGQRADALAQFQEAVRRDPNRETNWSRLGYLQATVGQRDLARQSLEKALHLSPKDWRAREHLAAVDESEDAGTTAAAGLVQAAQSAPEDERSRLVLRAANILRQQGAVNELTALVQQERAAGRADVDLLSLAGRVYLERGALAEAADAYRAGAVLGKDPGLWELAGEVETRMGKFDAADECFRNALERQDLATVHIARMRLHLKRHDAAGAKEELEHALASPTTEDPREMEELADGLIQMGRKADALTLLANFANEPEQFENLEVQRRAAKLAKDLRDKEVLSTVCARLAGDAGAMVSKEPACR